MEAALVAFLAPFLPYLIRLGQKVAEEAGARLGAEGWNFAKALWGGSDQGGGEAGGPGGGRRRRPGPEDEDALAAHRLQLRKRLGEDEALAGEVGRLWREAEAANVVTVTASGGVRPRRRRSREARSRPGDQVAGSRRGRTGVAGERAGNVTTSGERRGLGARLGGGSTSRQAQRGYHHKA
jgi:hypothetical protein